MREIICVSLFNGMGGAFMALEMSGFNVVQKISSEVDKYAIKANDAMFTDTIQIGDVSKIEVIIDDNGKVVGLKNDKGVEIMVCGGSPCQSFSFSGKRKGMATKDEQEILTLEHYLKLKAEDYEFEGQSYLFWEFVRLRDEIKPNYWFLENVEMGEKWEKVLSKAVGVNGVHVNSALLSAQNRKRVYWFNFGMEPMGLFGELGSIVTQPKDKGILLKDILESDVDEKYYLSEKMMNYLNTREKQTTNINSKGACFTAGGNSGGLHSQMDLIVHNTLPRSSKTGKGGTGPLSRNDGKTYCLDTGCTNAIEIRETLLSGLKSNDKRLKKLITETDFEGIDVAHLDTYNQAIDTEKSCALKLPHHNDKFLYEKKVIQLNDSKESNNGTQPYQQNRVYDVNGISPALCAFKADLLIAGDVKCVAMRGRNPENENGEKLPTEQMLEPRDDNKTNCLTTVSKDNLILENQVFGADYRSDEGIRIRENGKAPTLTSGAKNSGTQLNSLAVTHSSIRRLTPKEALRLQTVPEKYIDIMLNSGISDSQLYRMTGNGWTIEVISYLFNYIK